MARSSTRAGTWIPALISWWGKMAILSNMTSLALLVGWDQGERSFVDAVGTEIESGRLPARIGEKLIIGFYEKPTQTRRKIQLGRF